MNAIRTKRRLSENVWRIDVEAPRVAAAHRAGQFVLVMADAECGERIPLTIADADAAAGTVTLVFQTVGVSTMRLARLGVGDAIPALLGPLGRPSRIAGPGRRVVAVGGGIGVAPLLPIVRAHAAAGNEVTAIVGARTRDLLIFTDEMRAAVGDRLTVVTDDGSSGRRGLVTEPLAELCAARAVDEVIAIGPPAMMKFCSRTTEPYRIPTTVSLNTIMIDGTGMCGGCRVSVGGETRFVCVDGPEFDGHLVDWDQMSARLGAFRPQEAAARDHLCNLLKAT